MTKGTTMKNASRSLARLGVEALEDRRLLNGKSLLSLVNFSVPSAVPALVQSTPSRVHTTASLGESTGHVSSGLHLGAGNGSHSVEAGSGKTKKEPDFDKEGVGAKLKLPGREEADPGAKVGKNAHGHSDPAHDGAKGKDHSRHDGSSSDSHSDETDRNASAESAGTGDSPFSAPGPRPSSQPGGPPSLGIVFHHAPGASDQEPPPDVPTASNFLIASTILSAEETEQRNLSLFSLKVPGAGDRSWDAYWAKFLPVLPDRPERVMSAVAVGLQGAGETQPVSEEPPTPDTAEVGLLTARLPYGAGLGVDLERLLDELNDLGNGIKDAVGRGGFAFWLMAGAMATVGCEIARRRRQARAPLGPGAADDATLRWFPELAEPTESA